VSSKIQGRISSLRVEEGSVVKEGDVLATLDNADAQAAISKAKADIEYARAIWLKPTPGALAEIFMQQSELAGCAGCGKAK